MQAHVAIPSCHREDPTPLAFLMGWSETQVLAEPQSLSLHHLLLVSHTAPAPAMSQPPPRVLPQSNRG